MSDIYTKLCPDCDDEQLESEFYENQGNGDGLSTYCKTHMKVRLTVYQRERRARYKAMGLTINGKPFVGAGYLRRHLKKRAREAALEESFQSETQVEFCFVERKPMFRGLADSHLRQPTKSFSWRAA